MKFSLAFALLVSASAAYCSPIFINGQAARAVLGQYQFSQLNVGPGPQIYGEDAGVAYDPVHQMVWTASGNLIGMPQVNNRVLGIPAGFTPGPYDVITTSTSSDFGCPVCGAPATVVLGQVDFVSNTAGTSQVAASTAAGSMKTPTSVATDGNSLAVVDTGNNRVLIWNQVPQSNNAAPDVVLGQVNFTSVSDPAAISGASFRGPQGVWIQNGKLFVADTGNNRVLIWNSMPTHNYQAADLVLGQPNFTSNSAPSVSTTTQPVAAANKLWNPISVTSDGKRLFVADFAYNRILIWNSIPAQNQQAADVEIGQVDMSGSTSNDEANLCSGGPARCEKTLSLPRYALSDGTRLYVADSGNDRVLVYNTIPASNAAAADVVLGQPDFVSNVVQPNTSVITSFITNAGSTDTTPTPTSLAWDGVNLYVADPTDGRILLFTPGDIAVTGKQVLNNASELLVQEGLIGLSGTVVSGDTITVTIAVGGTTATYTYTIKSGDKLADVVTGVVNAINASPGDPNATAQASNVADTILLTAKSTSADLNTIAYTVTSSNTSDITATASGSYLAGGTSGTLTPGTIFEVDDPNGTAASGGLTDFDFETNAPNFPLQSPSQALPTTMNGPAGTQSSVQVYVDGVALPIVSAGPTRIVAQIPYTFENSSFTVDRTSVSVYVRSVRKDGSVVVSTAAPASFTDANPGLFGDTTAAQPLPAIGAMHQAGNPSVTVSLTGSVTVGDSITITVGSTPYTYTAVSGDSLNSMGSNLAALVNADPTVTATAGASGRIVVSARSAGSAGVGIAVAVSVKSGGTATETATTSNGTTCCANAGTGAVTANNPAVANEIVTLLGTGIGNVQDVSGNPQQPAVGVPYAGAQPNAESNTINATVNGAGTNATASLANGAVGVYQVYVQMPSTLPTTGVVPVYIAQGAFISNTVTLPVGPPASGSQTNPTIHGFIDQPSAGQVVGNSLSAMGWAADTGSPVTSIVLKLDGTELPSPTRASRPDVCAQYASSPDCEAGTGPGWTETISTVGLSNGTHTLTVSAMASNGDRLTQQATFTLTATSQVQSPGPALTYIPVTPCRLADTRGATGAFGGPMIAGLTSRDFLIPNGACNIPSSAAAYALNVTVLPSGGLGYLTVWPTGQALPSVSTLNSMDGRVKASAAIVSAGNNGGVSVFASNDTQLVLDVAGYFVDPTKTQTTGQLAFYPMTPCRVVDTRGSEWFQGSPLKGGQAIEFQLSGKCSIPATAQAYSMNFTAVPRGSLAYLTVWPSGQTQPLASTLNATTGQVTANAAIVQAGSNGDVAAYASNDTDLVVDVNGYFAPPGTGGLSLYTIRPCRVFDSRPNGGSPLTAVTSINLAASACGASVSAQAYVANATVVPTGGLGFLTLWPQGGTQPTVSTLNAADGVVTSNLAIVPASNGVISAFPSNPAQLVLDLSGYFAR